MNPVTAAAAPSPVGAYSQGAKVGPFIQVSGQLPIDPATGATDGDTIEEQTRRALANVAAVLTAAGATWRDVLGVRVFLASDDDFDAMDATFREVLEPPFPARTTVTAGLPPGVAVEIDALAVRL